MSTLNFSEQFGVAGFVAGLIYAMKPRAGFSPYIVFKVRELQPYLGFVKIFKFGKMIHLLRAGHCETPNAQAQRRHQNRYAVLVTSSGAPCWAPPQLLSTASRTFCEEAKSNVTTC